jgi:hypothetical protein
MFGNKYQQYLIANYMYNDTDLIPLKVYQFIKNKLFQSLNVIKWIPYPQIKNLSKIAEGGFSTIYKATWSNGIEIAVKKLHDSQNISKYYLNEVIFNIIYLYLIFCILKLIDKYNYNLVNVL